ncbi:MAG: Kelch repeat-containing protein [Acidobacteriota bacterium]
MKNGSCTAFVVLLIGLATAPGCNAQTVGLQRPADDSNRAAAGALEAIRGMAERRAAHSATLLRDGKVLIAGGIGGGESGISSAELFDAATNTFTTIGRMQAARSGHTATLLPNGKVLIAGGYNGNYLASSELYDPEARTFIPAGRMVTARSSHIAIPMRNGKILLAGGVGVGWTFLADAELYDPAANTFAATGSMLAARESHTATLLSSGKVLITGGHKGRRAQMTIYSSAEMYDPATGKFSAGGDMTRIRHKHEAVLLTDGRVLIVGGADHRDGDPAYTSVEAYDPTTGRFAVIGDMKSPRYKLQGTVVLLPDGKVLIAGGANRAEVFDPATRTFSYAAGDMGTTRLFATATLLSNRSVLITGGYSEGVNVSSNAWIYRT